MWIRPTHARRCLGVICLLALSGAAPQSAEKPDAPATIDVTPVPAGLRQRVALDAFYQQHVDVRSLPVVGSSKVSPYAMREAAYLVDQMLAGRDDLLRAMSGNKVRLTVMAAGEFTTDVPEHRHLKPKAFWNRRARGLGASIQVPCVSCAEENLLGLKGDPYGTESIMIHEFAHAVHLTGVRTIDPTFDRRLKAAYDAAMTAGLWKGKYAATNAAEYFAEGVQSWFDTNRPPDKDHNHVDTREELKAYDPVLAALVAEVFGDRAWRYVRPDRREKLDHLEGFDRDAAPAFTWPAEEKDAGAAG